MKFKFVSMILMLYSLNVFCQRLQKSDLVNYSYIINGKDNVGFITSGTGFIVDYRNQYYLVTNFHVFTGKDYKTNFKFPELRDTNTFISIIFQPVKMKSKFLVYLYPLFDNSGKKNYETFVFQNQIIDIAVMPIQIPKEAALFYLKIEDLDTLCNKQPESSLMFYGFPNGKFKNGWQPTEIRAKTIANPQKGDKIYDPFILFDAEPIKGMSGSPVYHYGFNGKIRLISIVSNSVNDNEKIKGRSICATLALELIKESNSHRRGSVKGVNYQY